MTLNIHQADNAGNGSEHTILSALMKIRYNAHFGEIIMNYVK